MKVPAEEVAVSEAILLRRWRADDVAPVRRAVTESIDHLRPWAIWVADGYSAEVPARSKSATGCTGSTPGKASSRRRPGA